jgi:hypothetical protein
MWFTRHASAAVAQQEQLHIQKKKLNAKSCRFNYLMYGWITSGFSFFRSLVHEAMMV